MGIPSAIPELKPTIWDSIPHGKQELRSERCRQPPNKRFLSSAMVFNMKVRSQCGFQAILREFWEATNSIPKTTIFIIETSLAVAMMIKPTQFSNSFQIQLFGSFTAYYFSQHQDTEIIGVVGNAIEVEMGCHQTKLENHCSSVAPNKWGVSAHEPTSSILKSNLFPKNSIF